jgi:dTDP-4-amino-4,6-dideoxygalactose transaminase
MSNLVERIRIPLFAEQLALFQEAIRAGQLVKGPHLEMLENSLARLFGKRYVVLTANGFSALFAALKAARPVSTKVLTAPASTCFAVVNAITAAGHEPYFADMDYATASLAGYAENADKGEALTTVVPDHFGIIAPDCRAPRRRPGLLIEDAAQSFISRSKTPTHSDILVLSFYPTKLINGIDGGAVLTDDSSLHARVKKLVSYDDQTEMEREPRYNLRMNNVNAAFALGTLVRVHEIAAKVRALHTRLSSALRKQGISILEFGPDEIPSRFIVVAETKVQRQSIMSQLRKAGIQVALELLQLCDSSTRAQCPCTERLLSTTFSVPFHPLISEKEVSAIESAIQRI